MSYHRGVARDTAGNSLKEASVTIYEDDGTTLATIYSDEDLATSLNNPFTTEADGVYEFYAAPGYYDIQVAKSGFSTTNLTNQKVGSIAGVIWVDSGDSETTAATPINRIDETFGSLGWSMQYSGAFSEDANGRIQYDGEPTITALVEANVTATDSAGSTNISLYGYVNNTLVDSTSLATGYSAAANASVNLSASFVVTLTTGDNVSLGITRDAGSGTVAIGRSIISILSL